MKGLLLLVLALLAAISVGAQEATPALTELERLKFENLQLQGALARALAEKADCITALGPLQAAAHQGALSDQARALKATIEAAHPGYVFDPQTGHLTPQPPAPSKKDEGPEGRTP